MNIAIVSTYPPRKCGIGIYTKNLADAMKGYDVEVITFKGYEYKDKRAKPILEKNILKSYIDATIYLKQFDIVIIQHEYILYNYIFFPIFLLLLKIKGIKTNIIMHTIAYYKGVAGFMFMLYHEFMLAFVDTLFLHTNIAQEKLNEKTLFKHNVVIVPHPIPKKYKRINVPRKKKVYNLLCFGFLDYTKGFDIVCKAVGGDKKYKLRIIGSINKLFLDKQTKYAVGLTDYARKYNNIKVEVKFATEKEKNAAFKWADFILIPYREIEQSGVLCDAWGHGKIPICSNIKPFMMDVLDSSLAITLDEINRYGVCFGKEDNKSLKSVLDFISSDIPAQKRISHNINRLVKKRSYIKSADIFIEESL